MLDVHLYWYSLSMILFLSVTSINCIILLSFRWDWTSFTYDLFSFIFIINFYRLLFISGSTMLLRQFYDSWIWFNATTLSSCHISVFDLFTFTFLLSLSHSTLCNFIFEVSRSYRDPCSVSNLIWDNFEGDLANLFYKDDNFDFWVDRISSTYVKSFLLL